jgi:hypothetical protein
MTTMFAKLSRTGGGYLYLDAVAPGPSGGAYAVANDGAGTVLVARLNSDGSRNWAKDITIPTLTPTLCAAASSSNRLAIVASTNETTAATTCVLMLDDTGSLVWESVLTNFAAFNTEGALIGSDNSVYLAGTYDGPLGSSQFDAVLFKLNPTTGAISWQVGLSETSTTAFTTTRYGSMAQLSGGDIVMTMWGPGSSAGDHAHVQRLSSSDGSVVWTRKINWGTSYSHAFLGIDGSDNVYVVGAAYDNGTSLEMPVVKLASDGSTLWARNVKTPSGAYTPVFDPFPGALTADTAGVQIAGNMIAGTFGHLLIPAAGTVAAASVPLTHYTPVVSYSSNCVRAGRVGATLLWGYADWSDGTFADNVFNVVSTVAGSGDDGTYGGDTPRVTVAFNLVAGTATVSTPGSWTRPSAPSLTLASDLGATVGAGTLNSSVVPPAITCAATSLGVVTQFGPDAYLRGYTVAAAPFAVIGSNIIVSRSYPSVGLTPPSTTFGTAVATRQQRATALGPTSNFGTPAYEPNTTRAADSLGIVLAGIGTPFATLGIAPEPSQRASSLGPTARVGTPTATNVLAVQASGSLFTMFGTASARLTQVATGLEPGAQFGTATVTLTRRASGFLATQLGTPRIVLYGFPAGFQRTQFGTPTVSAPRVCEAAGFLATNFGSPSAGSWVLHARSAYFRTKFGLAQAERTEP